MTFSQHSLRDFAFVQLILSKSLASPFPPLLPQTIHSFVVTAFRSSSSSGMFGVYSHALMDIPSNVNFMHLGPGILD